MPEQLNGKTAVITGATRGIGRQIALTFAAEGADIAFCARHGGEPMTTLENEIMALGRKCKGYVADVSTLGEAQRLVDQVVADFGKVDILVNNAGIFSDNAMKRMTEEQFHQVVDVNLGSVFAMTKAVQPVMWRQGGGAIVNMSSVVGIAGNYKQANYAASKAAIIGFSKSCAKEFAVRNIRVNVVCPGFIETEMTADVPQDIKERWCSRIPMKRAGTAVEVAQACLFLASDSCPYVTSVILPVCGGMEDA